MSAFTPYIYETPRLAVRRLVRGDASDFVHYMASPQVWHFVRPPLGKEAALKLLEENLTMYDVDLPCGRYAVVEKETGRFVGGTGVLRLDKDRVHLGYALLPEFWGKGYATELVLAGRDYFIGTNLIGGRVFALTNPANAASERVLKKTGFAVVEDKFGEDGSERLWVWPADFVERERGALREGSES